MGSQLEAYQQSVATNEQSVRCFFAALAQFGIPDSFNDIGCGDGHLVECAALLEIPSFGMDLNCESKEFPFGEIVQHDFSFGYTKKLKKAELTFCLEVGEHLPKEKARQLCSVLERATKNILVFSAAVPGQGGSGHLNEQYQPYWRKKLENCGFKYYEKASRALGYFWEEVAPDAWWYGRNVQVFR